MNKNYLEAIASKRDGKALTRDQIWSFIQGVVDESMPDYQVGAMLMAIYLMGMDARETADMTMAMAHLGDMMDLSSIDGPKVDKHSTGGVGDTTTLVLAPLVACCGAKVAKMSGRGLGHTGGTLDKLESIPGFNTALTQQQFLRQVNEIGVAVMGQTARVAPADKRLYALRDVTGTVGSFPLIVSSILSKKIAAGADAVVLDVKTGSGALMSTLEKARELARAMVEIGCRTGRKFSALVTDMDQPLGTHIGNALEVKEAIDVLAGRARGPLKEVSLALGAHMLTDARLAGSKEEALGRLQAAIDSGAGLKKLGDMIEWQGGDRRVTEDTARLPRAEETRPYGSARGGYLTHIDTTALGNAARLLGAGRMRKEDQIDPAVGMVMHKRLGDYVEKGEPLADLYLSARSDVNGCTELLDRAFTFSEEKVAERPLIIDEFEGK